MFEEDLDMLIWAGSLHGGFLFILILCLILQWNSWWPKYHHKTIQLSVMEKSWIQAIVDRWSEDLKTAVKKVIVARLSNGLLEFSDDTEEAESDLFLLILGLLDKVKEGPLQAKQGEGLPKDELVFLHRCIKMALQTSPYDLRGSRRVAVICDFIKDALKKRTYSLGMFNKFKRSCCCCPKWLIKRLDVLSFWYETGPSSITKKISRTQVAAAMILPVMLIAVDLGSDTNVLVTMWKYHESTFYAPDSSLQVWFLTVISGVVLLFSTLTLLSSNPLPSLLRGAHTAVAMGSREEEEQDVPLPLDTVTRHDMALAESTGEAGWQFVIQWMFYLTSVAFAVRTQNHTYEQEELTMDNSLIFSTFMSLLSLTMAQYKAQLLTREHSLSFLQKVFCFSSSLCSTASSLVLLTQLFYAVSETTGPVGLFLAILFLTLMTLFYRMCTKVRGSPLTVTQSGGFWRFIWRFFSHWFSSMMELLQLQSSRATVTKLMKRMFMQPQHLDFLFRENLVAHIILEIGSLCCLCISLGLAEHFPEGVRDFLLPPVYAKSKSPALHNFLMTAAILGPIGWILAQFLDFLNYLVDSGSTTCGLNFSYTEEEQEEEENVEEPAEDERTLRDVIVTTMYNTEEDETSTLRDDILSSMATVYNNKVPFECETGRWIHPEEEEELQLQLQEEQEEQEEEEQQEELSTGEAQEESMDMV